jgi:Domain of unknown function (DUF4390)
VRGIALYTGLFAVLTWSLAQANDIEVREARVRSVEEGLVLDADFVFDLTPRLAEVLSNGVPLYFRVEFELTRRRWYWWDETAGERDLQLRLSYHALSRHYRLSTGALQRSFPTLEEALDVLKHVRGWLVVDRTVTFADADYDAAVRMRLDTALLPKPFQLSALTSRELHLEAPWRRFTVHSPQQLPAPVESREPRPAER